MPRRTLAIVEATPLVRDHALDALRDAIMTGRYPPGARLVERELCDTLGVSRTSVREALRQLQSELLVEAEDYSGSRVATIGAADATDLYALREMLETTAIRRFVMQAGAGDLARLEQVFAEMTEAMGRGDKGQLARIAGAFYATLLSGAGSRIIQEVAQHLLARINYLRFRSMFEPGRLDGGLSEWDAVMRAIRARDAEAAVAAMANHLRNSRDAVVARLMADEQDTKPARQRHSGGQR